MSLSCRFAAKTDVATIVTIMAALHRHYRQPDPDRNALRRLVTRCLSADGRLGRIVLCFDGTEAIGLVTYCLAIPGPDFKPVMMIKDLFVLPDHRNAGCGAFIMRHLARICLEADISRLDLTTESWNEGAMRFYERLNGSLQDQKRAYRFVGPSLQNLAAAQDHQSA